MSAPVAAPPGRWEYGSEFHAAFEAAPPEPAPWAGPSVTYGCGRDAFAALLAFGRDRRGWKRVWVPSYFCQEVLEAALPVGLPLLPYRCGPDAPPPPLADLDLRAGDLVLRVNLFGLHALGPWAGQRPRGVEILENHTHDPWSARAFASDADYAFVSLRKTLPIPDGGVLWSPLGHPLPDPPPLTEVRRLASAEKLAAMLLKAAYLRGDAVEKEAFRDLAVAGEGAIGEGAPSAMTPWTQRTFGGFPAAAWRKLRRRNHAYLAGALEGLPGLRVLPGPPDEGACPFAAVVVTDRAERRDRLRQGLLEARIFPGSHWSLEKPAVRGLPPEHLDLSRRLLTLPCDLRYRESDLERVAGVVRRLAQPL